MATLVYVVDTTALLAKWVLMVPLAFTTSLVVAEAKDRESREATNTAIELNKLRVVNAPLDYVHRAVEAAKRLGLHTSLSDADISVAALALYMRDAGNEVVVITDDYALQNLLAQLGLQFKPLRTRGIGEKRSYVVRCPACGYVSTRPGETHCPICGTPLRRYRRRRATK